MEQGSRPLADGSPFVSSTIWFSDHLIPQLYGIRNVSFQNYAAMLCVGKKIIETTSIATIGMFSIKSTKANVFLFVSTV